MYTHIYIYIHFLWVCVCVGLGLTILGWGLTVWGSGFPVSGPGVVMTMKASFEDKPRLRQICFVTMTPLALILKAETLKPARTKGSQTRTLEQATRRKARTCTLHPKPVMRQKTQQVTQPSILERSIEVQNIVKLSH